MSLDPSEPFGERLGVAVLASGTDLRAAADWVPGRIGPLDVGVEGHLTLGNAKTDEARSPISAAGRMAARLRTDKHVRSFPNL